MQMSKSIAKSKGFIMRLLPGLDRLLSTASNTSSAAGRVDDAAAILLVAVGELGLKSNEHAAIRTLSASAKRASPERHQQLVEIATAPDHARRYSELLQRYREVASDERSWLVGLVREAMKTSEENPWAVLYLALAFRMILNCKIDHRLNPRSEVRTPSPFVYAMQ